jgi:hypothetical protein
MYAALCNQAWKRRGVEITDERHARQLGHYYDCSWRYAGGLVAEMRNEWFAEHPLEIDPDQCLRCGHTKSAHLVEETEMNMTDINGDPVTMKNTYEHCPDKRDSLFYPDWRGREDYINFYCSGISTSDDVTPEGVVTERIEEKMSSIGWEPTD